MTNKLIILIFLIALICLSFILSCLSNLNNGICTDNFMYIATGLIILDLWFFSFYLVKKCMDSNTISDDEGQPELNHFTVLVHSDGRSEI